DRRGSAARSDDRRGQDAASACKGNRRCWRAACRYWLPPGAVGAGSTRRDGRRLRAPPQPPRCAWKANQPSRKTRDRTRPPGSTKVAASVPQPEMILQVAISRGGFKETIMSEQKRSTPG